MSSLMHHGILGQRWGVRRFQNKDGTRTAAGKKQEKQKRLKKTSKDYASIKESLSDNDLKFLDYSSNDIKRARELGTLGRDLVDYGRVAHRVIQKDKNGTPVTYVDANWMLATSFLTGKNSAKIISIDLATRAGDEYRGKGHAVAAGKKMVKWFDTHGYKDYEYMEWGAKEKNIASQKTAEKLGFKRYEGETAPGWTIYTYEHKAKHTSIGGTMYIEGNALILGDSSYLEHHGIKGQRWGVRRFQNRDGSLTNAGRKRLGYVTKGATQTVKKAFKAGVKTGAKAVKAAKAQHKKAEEKKIEKKKEKASKTRAGVYANKDLFTSKELKELNAKFEEQDKLAMARLKKGVEIAKAVGQYAQTAKQIGDAYQSITGKSILGHITEINNKKEADAKKAEDEAKEKAAKDLQEARNKDAAKRALQANIDKYNQQKADEYSEARNNELDKQGNKTASKTKLAEYIDRYNQDKAAQEQIKQMMKNQKLQEYIDRANQAQREKDAATLKETTERGQKAIEILSKGGKFNSDLPESTPTQTLKATPDSSNLMDLVRKANATNSLSENSTRAAKALDLLGEKGGGFNTETPKSASAPAPKPKPTPSSNNLMAQIRAAQTKLEKPNKNETPAEHKEAQKKLNALEKVANEYKAAANKPGADPAEITEKLLKKNKNILDEIKHMDFSDTDYLEHYGVRGMKWGKHLMAGKGGGLYEGTALGAGGGGGPMTEEERKKAEALKKKKLEEAKKKAEAAAKEKEIEKKAKEIGVSVKAYKNYSIDKNNLPGKHHYTTSNKLHGEASSSVAKAQAAERQAHMNRAKAASLMRKVNSSHMFDADGYHISQQRGDDRNEAKRLKKEAKTLDKASKKALKKFYKKRYKSDRERQKWRNSTSGKYHHLMRHYEIQNGVLFIDESVALEHHGVKGQKWGVRRFQNEDGSLTDKGRKHYEKALAKIDRMQTHSDARRGRLERQHPFAVTGSAIAAAVAAGLSIAATGGASVAAIAAGSAISAAVSAGITHASYSVNEAWEGRGTKHRQKKRKEYEEMLNHDGLIVSDGTLYLEHHGIRGQKWGVRRFQNKDGTRTALGKKREMYGATVSVRGQKSSESVGVTKKQAKGKAAAEILKSRNDLSEKERKSLQKHVDRAEKETAKLEKYKEKKKREQERNTEESKVRAWQALGSGVISPDKYKQNIDAINKNHKREIDYLNKMDERDMANERAFTRKTVAKGMGYAVAATAGLAGITAATTGWMVISGYAAVGGGMVGAISGEMKRAQYREERRKEMGIDAKHDALSIQNGTLFINAGEPYLEHHGVKGMKWGKHLMAGKGEAGAGGGSGEDDEKLKEMAKKAGMTVAEYRTKMASKLSGAASKVGEKISVKDKHLVINGSRSGSRGLAVGETGEKPKSFKEKAYNALGGKYKSQAAEAHKDMVHYKNEADDKARRANAQGRAANANKRSGNVREYMANKEGARQLDAEAKGARTSQWEATKKANRAQWKYDHSIAGLYDKATGKYKQAHKKTAIPKTMDRWKYEYKDGPNSKLFNNGKGKAKTAKEQAKADVWNAADHQIKAKEYNDVASSQGGNTSYFGQVYKNAAAREARLAEGSYRRAAALGKQAASEDSTSSRPRARKKRVTSGGSGVSVRKPGRKPVSRTKRVTKSSTGVKRRGATGTGARVR